MHPRGALKKKNLKHTLEVNFLRGFGSLVVRMVREERRERERTFWVDRKTCKKKRIATDLYYYYGEIDYKINAGLATAYELFIKGILKKYTFILFMIKSSSLNRLTCHLMR